MRRLCKGHGLVVCGSSSRSPTRKVTSDMKFTDTQGAISKWGEGLLAGLHPRGLHPRASPSSHIQVIMMADAIVCCARNDAHKMTT